MGRTCCVPYCRSNYNGSTETVSTFGFPKEKVMFNKWKSCIRRPNFMPRRDSVVCVKHFETSVVIYEDRAIRDDGSELIVKRHRPKLTLGAYPTIFPDLPSAVVLELPPNGKPPDSVSIEIVDSSKRHSAYDDDDVITDFTNFKAFHKQKAVSGWSSVEKGDYVSFFKINGAKQVLIVVYVLFDLTVNICIDNTMIPPSKFQWILGKRLVCNRWTKFSRLLQRLKSRRLHSLT